MIFLKEKMKNMDKDLKITIEKFAESYQREYKNRYLLVNEINNFETSIVIRSKEKETDTIADSCEFSLERYNNYLLVNDLLTIEVRHSLSWNFRSTCFDEKVAFYGISFIVGFAQFALKNLNIQGVLIRPSHYYNLIYKKIGFPKKRFDYKGEKKFFFVIDGSTNNSHFIKKTKVFEALYYLIDWLEKKTGIVVYSSFGFQFQYFLIFLNGLRDELHIIEDESGGLCLFEEEFRTKTQLSEKLDYLTTKNELENFFYKVFKRGRAVSLFRNKLPSRDFEEKFRQ